MRFEWDEAKSLSNRERHGLDFDEVRELFVSGRDYLEIFDADHSELEDRFIAIGPIGRGIVVVVWTGPDDDTVRIISARWATRAEIARFHLYMDEKR